MTRIVTASPVAHWHIALCFSTMRSSPRDGTQIGKIRPDKRGDYRSRHHEPPVVARDGNDRDPFHLLDGHLGLDILKQRGEAEVVCLVALDDEAFTYNKRASRIAIIQEHKMILNAIKKGVSEGRLARVLNVDIANIRAKRNLLVGICPEAAELLRDKHVPINALTELRGLKPIRQIEAAPSMITMNRYSINYAKSLVASTPDDQLAEGRRRKSRGLTEEQIVVMQRKPETLDPQFKLVEQTYGADQLDLVQAVGYVNRLLSSAPVVRHLAQHHAGILSELQKVRTSNRSCLNLSTTAVNTASLQSPEFKMGQDVFRRKPNV